MPERLRRTDRRPWRGAAEIGPAVLLLSLMATPGCLRLGFESRPSDARRDRSRADGDGPAAEGAPPVTDLWPLDGPAGSGDSATDSPAALPPFSSPTLIAALSDPSATDDDPTLTADRLEIYFNSDRPGGSGKLDLWRSTRVSVSAPWGAPAPVAELNSAADESTPEVFPGGLTIYFASTRPGGQGDYDIWMSTRASRAEKWSIPKPVVELSSPSYDAAAAVGSSLLTLVMYSTRQGTSDLFASFRSSSSGLWTAPAPITELNSAAEELSPFLASGGLTILFESDRGTGSSNDLYSASRPTLGAPFGPAQALAELNSPAFEGDPWLSGDGRYIAFCSGRSGDLEIYEAWR